jgi:outer membrane protein W
MIARQIVHAGVLMVMFLMSSNSAVAQMAVEAEAGSFVGGLVLLSDPTTTFTIARQEAAPLRVAGGEVKNAIAMGVNAGIVLGERFGLEGMYAWIPGTLRAREGLESYGGSVDVSAIRYGATVRYEFAPERRLQPFAGLGVGGETTTFGKHLSWQRQTRISPFVAAGASYWLEDDVAVRVRATRDIRSPDGVPTNQLMVTVGLNLREKLR